MNKIAKIVTVITLISPLLFANSASCKGCHGSDFRKKALGKSKIIKNMSKNEIISALKGYKNGTYGGKLKDMMAGRVMKLSEKDIVTLANEIKR